MTLMPALVVAAAIGWLAPLTSVAGAEPAAQPVAPADVERWLGFWDKLVVTVADPQVTCDKLATGVTALVDKHKEAISIARTARSQGQNLPEAAQQHMLDGVKKMIPTMHRCAQHAKVRAAFAKLDVTRK